MPRGKEGLSASYTVVYPPTDTFPKGERVRHHDYDKRMVVGVGPVEDLAEKGAMVNGTLVKPGFRSKPGPAGVYISVDWRFDGRSFLDGDK